MSSANKMFRNILNHFKIVFFIVLSLVAFMPMQQKAKADTCTGTQCTDYSGFCPGPGPGQYEIDYWNPDGSFAGCSICHDYTYYCYESQYGSQYGAQYGTEYGSEYGYQVQSPPPPPTSPANGGVSNSAAGCTKLQLTWTD